MKPLSESYQSLISQKISTIKFLDTFNNEDDCLELYFNLKFAGRNCQKCNRQIVSNYTRVYRKNKNGVPKKAYRCRSCHTYIYPLSNTIFRNSSIPITHIFYMIFVLCASRSSISASDVIRQIPVSYKTAHRLMMLIRMVLYNSNKEEMSGEVEIDEAFIGKGSKMYNWSGISTRKQPIIGLIERRTKYARLFLVPDRSAITINKLIRENVRVGSTIYTDSWRGYNDLSKYYSHEIIDHSKREYVRDDTHTNSIENLWGQLKRNLRKAHIKISDKYVHLYLSEACWRHNSKVTLPMKLFNEILIRSFSIYNCTIT